MTLKRSAGVSRLSSSRISSVVIRPPLNAHCTPKCALRRLSSRPIDYRADSLQRSRLRQPHAPLAPGRIVIVAEKMEHTVNHQQPQFVDQRMAAGSGLCACARQRNDHVAKIFLGGTGSGGSERPAGSLALRWERQHVCRRVDAEEVAIEPPQRGVSGDDDRQHSSVSHTGHVEGGARSRAQRRLADRACSARRDVHLNRRGPGGRGDRLAARRARLAHLLSSPFRDIAGAGGRRLAAS